MFKNIFNRNKKNKVVEVTVPTLSLEVQQDVVKNIGDFLDINSINKFHITNIESKLNIEGGIEVIIETYYPGVIIGQGGKVVRNLSHHLFRIYPDNNVQIYVKECELWKNI